MAPPKTWPTAVEHDSPARLSTRVRCTDLRRCVVLTEVTCVTLEAPFKWRSAMEHSDRIGDTHRFLELAASRGVRIGKRARGGSRS